MKPPLKFGEVEWMSWDNLDDEQQRSALRLWADIARPRRAVDRYSFAVSKTREVVMVGRYEGPAEAPEVELCEFCDGDGWFECQACDGIGQAIKECEFGVEHEVPCRPCDESGYVECEKCHGTGSEES